jgi:hypothetical protein
MQEILITAHLTVQYSELGAEQIAEIEIPFDIIMLEEAYLFDLEGAFTSSGANINYIYGSAKTSDGGRDDTEIEYGHSDMAIFNDVWRASEAQVQHLRTAPDHFIFILNEEDEYLISRIVTRRHYEAGDRIVPRVRIDYDQGTPDGGTLQVTYVARALIKC